MIILHLWIDSEKREREINSLNKEEIQNSNVNKFFHLKENALFVSHSFLLGVEHVTSKARKCGTAFTALQTLGRKSAKSRDHARERLFVLRAGATPCQS
jgi:hypothetical protein